MSASSAASGTVLSVTELTLALRELVGGTFAEVAVRGEVSRVHYHGSGHVYLTLKDEDAVLAAAIWRTTARRLRFRLEEGQEIVAFGAIDVYPPRGTYQLIVRAVEPLGEGALRAAFDQMRRRLEAEGLFDPARKKPLPSIPRRIALITSPTGAAIQDLITVIRRRFPAVTLVLVPVRVQGDGAAGEIAHAVRFADEHARADILVVGRGGGSLEDLWAFNEEVVARAIAAAKTPVVSAVGHETDVTIADLAADVRAATPSQAGELVVPSREDLAHRLGLLLRRHERALRRTVDLAWQRLEAIADRPVLRDPVGCLRGRRERWDALGHRLGAQSPLARLRERRARTEELGGRLLTPLARRLRAAREDLDGLEHRGRRGVHHRLESGRRAVAALDDRLRALSPLRVLGRGYALVSREDGRLVRRGGEVAVGERIVTRVGDGSRIKSRVEETLPPEEVKP